MGEKGGVQWVRKRCCGGWCQIVEKLLKTPSVVPAAGVDKRCGEAKIFAKNDFVKDRKSVAR